MVPLNYFVVEFTLHCRELIHQTGNLIKFVETANALLKG